MLTVGHVWVKQVSGAVVVMRFSIRAPVGFTERRRRMGSEHGDPEETKTHIK